MTVVGFNITSLKGETYPDKRQENANININSNPRIIAVKKADIPVEGIADVLSIEFKFETSYDPRVGSIVVEGELFLQTDDSDKVLELWDEKSALHESVLLDVMNTILRKSLVKVVQLADDLRLPPPVRFPMYQRADETETKKKSRQN